MFTYSRKLDTSFSGSSIQGHVLNVPCILTMHSAIIAQLGILNPLPWTVYIVAFHCASEIMPSSMDCSHYTFLQRIMTNGFISIKCWHEAAAIIKLKKNLVIDSKVLGQIYLKRSHTTTVYVLKIKMHFSVTHRAVIIPLSSWHPFFVNVFFHCLFLFCFLVKFEQWRSLCVWKSVLGHLFCQNLHGLLNLKQKKNGKYK